MSYDEKGDIRLHFNEDFNPTDISSIYYYRIYTALRKQLLNKLRRIGIDRFAIQTTI